jgi:methylenetetrahydrofolate dehydrogenase (NADP+)/methenyltetrahydrofolate cyclohydrolase
MRKFSFLNKSMKTVSANIIDGKAIAEAERISLAKKVAERIEQGKPPPGLAVILVGEDSASQIYVQKKRDACFAVGFHSEAHFYPQDVSQEVLLAKIEELNHSPKIHGILVQLPLPAHILSDEILEKISPRKDVDGFHAYNMGKLAQNKPGLRPCTPSGIMTLLSHTDLVLSGSQACIIGASNIVGRPMAFELLNKGATITICNSKTRDLPQQILRADLVVAAIGKPRFIQGEWIKPGACVIDVGINRGQDKKLVGDVDFDSAQKRAKWITPVPGGVGPMTVLALLNNTLLAAEAEH